MQLDVEYSDFATEYITYTANNSLFTKHSKINLISKSIYYKLTARIQSTKFIYDLLVNNLANKTHH